MGKKASQGLIIIIIVKITKRVIGREEFTRSAGDGDIDDDDNVDVDRKKGRRIMNSEENADNLDYVK